MSPESNSQPDDNAHLRMMTREFDALQRIAAILYPLQDDAKLRVLKHVAGALEIPGFGGV